MAIVQLFFLTSFKIMYKIKLISLEKFYLHYFIEFFFLYSHKSLLTVLLSGISLDFYDFGKVFNILSRANNEWRYFYTRDTVWYTRHDKITHKKSCNGFIENVDFFKEEDKLLDFIHRQFTSRGHSLVEILQLNKLIAIENSKQLILESLDKKECNRNQREERIEMGKEEKKKAEEREIEEKRKEKEKKERIEMDIEEVDTRRREKEREEIENKKRIEVDMLLCAPVKEIVEEMVSLIDKDEIMIIVRKYEEVGGFSIMSLLWPACLDNGWEMRVDKHCKQSVHLAPWIAMSIDEGGAVVSTIICDVSQFILDRDYFVDPLKIYDYLSIHGHYRINGLPLLASTERPRDRKKHDMNMIKKTVTALAIRTSKKQKMDTANRKNNKNANNKVIFKKMRVCKVRRKKKAISPPSSPLPSSPSSSVCTEITILSDKSEEDEPTPDPPLPLPVSISFPFMRVYPLKNKVKVGRFDFSILMYICILCIYFCIFIYVSIFIYMHRLILFPCIYYNSPFSILNYHHCHYCYLYITQI